MAPPACAGSARQSPALQDNSGSVVLRNASSEWAHSSAAVALSHGRPEHG